MKINKIELDKLINDGMIIDNRHKTLPLTILNYSKFAQFEKNWAPLTLQARGLVIDDDYNVVAIPFKKFFNIEETKKEDIPKNESIKVYKKMDGSLGILFFYMDQWHMATRGSFTSEQAVKGMEILNKKYSDLISLLDKDITYLFEIIYKENRIVIDYGDKEDLILLGAINKNDGIEISLEDIDLPFSKVESVDEKDFDILKKRNIKNEEGYVVRFLKSNFRIKIKFDEYVMLHGIVTEFSNKKVWEILKENMDLKTVLEMVPDEFYDKVKVVYDDLKSQFDALKSKAITVSQEAKKFDSRKEMALWLNSNYRDIMPLVFGLVDNKDVDSIIMRMIKPEFEKI
jgi:RNA ligase